MTKMLFLADSYMKESKATVLSVKNGKLIFLDQTVFFPKGGGQPHDIGKLIKGNKVYEVVYVRKLSGEISHEVDNDGLQTGDEVKCVLNWARRYKLMRSHTAAHVFVSLLNKGTGASYHWQPA